MSYDFIIVDSVLVAYTLFNAAEEELNMKLLVKIGNQKVYRNLIRRFIETMDFLKKKFLSDTGEVICLFDNYHSREELRSLLVPLKEHEFRKTLYPAYKAQRRSAKIEFYNTLDKIKYYMRIRTPEYHTANIPNLEADDLVRPCIEFLQKGKEYPPEILLVTNDSDWCRYLHEFTHWLPDIHGEPEGINEFVSKHGFVPTEEKIILNKIMHGDAADNIQQVFPEFPETLKEYIVREFNTVADFMFEAPSHKELGDYAKLIKERETHIKAAYQMLAAIPVTPQHFAAIFTTGRDAVMVKEVLDEVIFGAPAEENTFTFGEIPIPRRDPRP
jgi:5'-3' exonuclease, N-terminal resolvase-like domain